MDTLLNEFKTYMTITWQDATLNLKISDMLKRSKTAINQLVDASLNYDNDLIAKELLFNRVRYDYNNALEYFEDNFSKEILRLQLREGVKANEIETTTP